MLVLSIDPGSKTHGVVLYDAGTERVVMSDKAKDSDGVFALVAELRTVCHVRNVRGIVSVERISPRQGMGGDVLLTAEWSARFVQAAHDAGCDVYWLKRHAVLRELDLGGVAGNRDAAVRRAMVERHGPSKAEAVGRKASPGPLYGVSSHSWQALGLAVAAYEQSKRGQSPTITTGAMLGAVNEQEADNA